MRLCRPLLRPICPRREGGDRSALGVAKAARAELASHASSPNTLFVFFDEPVALSKVCFWNYSKTPARGARHQ